MNEMLVRENNGLLSNSLTVEEFLERGRKIEGKYIKQLEFELGLQESMELIAKSAITRKLGDESSSLQAASFIEPTNPVIAETRGNNQESNFIKQKREKLEWSRGDGYDT